MCGLVGIFGGRKKPAERREIVRRMAETLVHRGPDGEGFAQVENCDFGFRRLAIIDVVLPPCPRSVVRRHLWRRRRRTGRRRGDMRATNAYPSR